MSHYRRLAPEASGCFIWQYNEPWPTCAFSIVDYYTVPKMAYYALARANSPVILSMQDDSWCSADGTLQGKFFLTADAEFTGEVKAEIYDVNGKIRWQNSAASTWHSGSTEVFAADVKLPDGINFVRMRVFRDGREIFAHTRIFGVPDFKTAFTLPETTLEVTQISCENGILRANITNTGKYTALYARVSLPELPEKSVYFADNYLIIPPGETAEITAKVPADAEITALEISGWNC